MNPRHLRHSSPSPAAGLRCVVLASALLAGLSSGVSAECQVEFGSSIPPTQPQRSTEDGVSGDWTAIVVADRARRFCSPDPRQPLPASLWGFGDKVWVYGFQGNYYLVGEANGQNLSWMHESNVQVWRRCLKDGKHHTWRKALIVNNPLSDAHGAEAADEVPILAGPSHNHRVRSRAHLFTVRFVYKEKTVGDDTYFLLGRDQEWSPRRIATALDGWVDSTLVISWPHRMALEIDKTSFDSRAPVAVFKSARTLRDHLDRPNVKIPNDALFGAEDPSDRASWPHYQERFPILDYDVQSGTNQKIFEIGFIGDMYSRKNKSQRVARSSLPPVQAIQAKVRQLDLIFVMDATASMQPYFESVKKSVMDFVQEASQQSRVQLSLAVYRDWADGGGVFELAQPPTDDKDTFLRSLRSLKAYSNPGDTTMTEALLNGVRRTLEGVRFRQGSTRALLLIGDHGNPDDARGRTDGALVHTGLQRARLSVHAIQVQPRGSEHETALDLFRRQAQELINANHGTGSLITVPPGGSSVAEAAKRILAGLQATAAQSESTYEAIDDLASGMSVDDAKKKWGFALVRNIDRMLKKEWGVSGVDDLDMTRYSQLCMLGWVAEKDPQSGARAMMPTLYIERAELGAFVGALHRMKDVLTANEDDSRDVASLITRAIERTTGDERMSKSETYDEFFKRAFGLPVKSPLLKLSEEGLREKWKGGGRSGVREQLLDTVSRSLTYLQAAADNRRVEARNVGGGRYREVPVSQEPWFFKDRTGEYEYAWIPYAYFP